MFFARKRRTGQKRASPFTRLKRERSRANSSIIRLQTPRARAQRTNERRVQENKLINIQRKQSFNSNLRIYFYAKLRLSTVKCFL